MKSIKGVRIIVTGASEGIGKMLCQELDAMGAEVWALARSQDKLFQLQEKGSKNIQIYPIDIRNQDEISRFYSHSFNKNNAPEILINGAGVGHFAYTEETTIDDWNRMIATNLTGPFLMSQGVIPFLKKKKMGTIVNINSVAGLQAFKNASAYCSSKFGLHGLTQVMREELRKFNVRVIGVHPGAVDSSWWKKIEGAENLPFNKMLQTEDVVHAIISALTSDDRAVQEEIVLRYVGGNF